MARQDVINIMWSVLGFLFLCSFCLCGVHYVMQNDFGHLARCLIVAFIAAVIAVCINAAILAYPKKGE